MKKILLFLFILLGSMNGRLAAASAFANYGKMDRLGIEKPTNGIPLVNYLTGVRDKYTDYWVVQRNTLMQDLHKVFTFYSVSLGMTETFTDKDIIKKIQEGFIVDANDRFSGRNWTTRGCVKNGTVLEEFTRDWYPGEKLLLITFVVEGVEKTLPVWSTTCFNTGILNPRPKVYQQEETKPLVVEEVDTIKTIVYETVYKTNTIQQTQCQQPVSCECPVVQQQPQQQQFAQNQNNGFGNRLQWGQSIPWGGGGNYWQPYNNGGYNRPQQSNSNWNSNSNYINNSTNANVNYTTNPQTRPNTGNPFNYNQGSPRGVLSNGPSSGGPSGVPSNGGPNGSPSHGGGGGNPGGVITHP